MDDMARQGPIGERELLTMVEQALLESGSEPGFALTMDSELGHEGWDSLGQVTILAELDKRFDGTIATYKGAEQARSMRAIAGMLRDLGLM